MTIQATEIVKLASALADTATVVSGIVANGAPSWADLPKLFAVVGVFKEFGTVDYKQVLPEAETLSDADITAIVAAFNGHLNITQPTAKQTIEVGFEMILRAGEAVKTIKDLIDQILPKPAAAT